MSHPDPKHDPENVYPNDTGFFAQGKHVEKSVHKRGKTIKSKMAHIQNMAGHLNKMIKKTGHGSKPKHNALKHKIESDEF